MNTLEESFQKDSQTTCMQSEQVCSPGSDKVRPVSISLNEYCTTKESFEKPLSPITSSTFSHQTQSKSTLSPAKQSPMKTMAGSSPEYPSSSDDSFSSSLIAEKKSCIDTARGTELGPVDSSAALHKEADLLGVDKVSLDGSENLQPVFGLKGLGTESSYSQDSLVESFSPVDSMDSTKSATSPSAEHLVLQSAPLVKEVVEGSFKNLESTSHSPDSLDSAADAQYEVRGSPGLSPESGKEATTLNVTMEESSVVTSKQLKISMPDVQLQDTNISLSKSSETVTPEQKTQSDHPTTTEEQLPEGETRHTDLSRSPLSDSPLGHSSFDSARKDQSKPLSETTDIFSTQKQSESLAEENLDRDISDQGHPLKDSFVTEMFYLQPSKLKAMSGKEVNVASSDVISPETMEKESLSQLVISSNTSVGLATTFNLPLQPIDSGIPIESLTPAKGTLPSGMTFLDSPDVEELSFQAGMKEDGRLHEISILKKQGPIKALLASPDEEDVSWPTAREDDSIKVTQDEKKAVGIFSVIVASDHGSTHDCSHSLTGSSAMKNTESGSGMEETSSELGKKLTGDEHMIFSNVADEAKAYIPNGGGRNVEKLPQEDKSATQSEERQTPQRVSESHSERTFAMEHHRSPSQAEFHFAEMKIPGATIVAMTDENKLSWQTNSPPKVEEGQKTPLHWESPLSSGSEEEDSDIPLETEECTTAEAALDTDEEQDMLPKDSSATGTLATALGECTDAKEHIIIDAKPSLPDPDVSMVDPEVALTRTGRTSAREKMTKRKTSVKKSSASGKKGKSAGLSEKTGSRTLVQKTSKSSPQEKEAKNAANITVSGKMSTTHTKSAMHSKSNSNPSSPGSAFYVDLAYVPNHGSAKTADVEFFRKVRASHYVLSGDDPSADEPSRALLNALLDGKAQWGHPMQVTVIPTHDTAVVRDWYRDTHELQRELDVLVLASNSTVVMQNEAFPACKIEF
uniref:Microtubule-associated protein 1S n=1 Tax=Eptatretus burgeri TaxID=7764 RepID=A0A8C4QAV0_EPTBU